jgi:hypothetical protein
MLGPGQLCRLALLAPLLLFLHLFAQTEANPSDVTEMVRTAATNFKSREPQRNDYTYLAHIVRTEFDRDGQPKGNISGTYEIMFLEGSPYRRLIQANGQPLSQEREKHEQLLEAAEAERRRSGEGSRQTLRASFSTLIAQLPEQFRLRSRGKQLQEGRQALMIEALPDAQRPPTMPEQEYARHFKLKVWIDLAETQIVRIESQVISDKLSLDQDLPSFSPDMQLAGMKRFRVEVAHGTTDAMEWTKVNDEAWLPKSAYWKTARETLVDVSSSQPMAPVSFPVQLTWSFSDYKKFRVDARVVPK